MLVVHRVLTAGMVQTWLPAVIDLPTSWSLGRDEIKACNKTTAALLNPLQLMVKVLEILLSPGDGHLLWT